MHSDWFRQGRNSEKSDCQVLTKNLICLRNGQKPSWDGTKSDRNRLKERIKPKIEAICELSMPKTPANNFYFEQLLLDKSSFGTSFELSSTFYCSILKLKIYFTNGNQTPRTLACKDDNSATELWYAMLTTCYKNVLEITHYWK
mgnify:FL=1